jgi:hypothetical protein
MRIVEVLGRQSFVVYLLASAAFSSMPTRSPARRASYRRGQWPRSVQVFSGAPPAYTGVTGNEWFVREDMQFFAPAPVSIEDTDAAIQTIAHDLDTSKESSHVRNEVVHSE